MKWLGCVLETPLYGNMAPSALFPGRGRALTRSRPFSPRATAPVWWDHSWSPADFSSKNNSWFTVHCSSRAFLQRGSCSRREQQGKPRLNNIALTTLPHQQSVLSPHWRISADVPHPKFRPASCSSDMLPQVASSDAGYMEDGRKVWVWRSWRAADAAAAQAAHSTPRSSSAALRTQFSFWFECHLLFLIYACGIHKLSCWPSHYIGCRRSWTYFLLISLLSETSSSSVCLPPSSSMCLWRKFY